MCLHSAGGRLQLTRMHLTYVALHEVTWLYGVHRTRRDGSSFMWHQPCQRCKYTTSRADIKKQNKTKNAKKEEELFIHVESIASAVSLLDSGE